MADDARTLFVLWQCQKTRRHVPVARLRTLSAPGGEVFELAYVRGVERARSLGFEPFVAFPRVDRVYRDSALFPFFKNRILSRTRPDYADHVASLGLPPDSDPMDLLARNGGRRETDHIEIVPPPTHDLAADRYEVLFWVRGVRHVEGAEQAITALSPGATLHISLDPDNPVNEKAALLRAPRASRVGFIPDYLLDDLHALMQRDPAAVSVVVQRMNPPPLQPQRRLLCKLSAPWPPGFTALSGASFEPLASPAAFAA
ncbi:MAG: hypothetical protein R3B70_15670 [Polyangiaceae bacterium]